MPIHSWEGTFRPIDINLSVYFTGRIVYCYSINTCNNISIFILKWSLKTDNIYMYIKVILTIRLSQMCFTNHDGFKQNLISF